MMQGHLEDSILTRTAPHSASVVQVEQAKLLPWILVCSIVSGFSIGLSIFAISTAHSSDRETRMLEYYVMELDGKAMKAGIIRPEESWSGKKQESKP
jgi:hypothetical protein